MRRRSAGRQIRARVSVRVMPSSSTRPSSGCSSPEMMLTSVVLPQPERPKSATTPGVGASSCANSLKASQRLRTETRSMMKSDASPEPSASEEPVDTPGEELGEHEPEDAERDGEHGESHRRGLATRLLDGGVERER